MNSLKLTIGVCWLACHIATRPVDADETYDQHKNLVYREVHGVGLVMDVFVPKGRKKKCQRDDRTWLAL